MQMSGERSKAIAFLKAAAHYQADVWTRTFRLFFENKGLAAAGNMAFLTMLSLFPFIIFLVSVSGVLGQTERGEEAIAFMMSTLPLEVATVLKGPIDGIVQNARPDLLTGSILFAVWTAANGVEAARDILITAFGRQHARAFWLRRLESLGVVIVGAVLVLIAMSVLVIGPALFKAAGALFPEEVVAPLGPIWKLLNLAISPAVLCFGIYGVFLALTPRRARNAYRLPGTILCLAFLLATAKGLSVYLSYAGNYDVTYGSLAGIVITQLFCFVVALGFTLGAELNAALANMKTEKLAASADH